MAPFGQGQEMLRTRPTQETFSPAVTATAPKEIPYDYVARFTLRGENGRRVQDVITISAEAAFIATSISYSFTLPPPPPTPPPPPIPPLILALVPTADRERLLRALQRWLCGIDFRYSIIDSGTGRELQNQPIHNIAGLGDAAGSRPFRPLAKPALYLPRSTIRIEVQELYPVEQDDFYKEAELYIVLHGYKILGYTGGPT